MRGSADFYSIGSFFYKSTFSTFRRLLFGTPYPIIMGGRWCICVDNLQFGQFIAQLRREGGMTQKQLAARLNVTDKAVSKWETGKGFPDIKLMEALAEALDVTLVELIQCQRHKQDTLTVAQAEAVVSQAMDQSQKVTARRYLKLLRRLLVAIAILAAYAPVTKLLEFASVWFFTWYYTSSPSFGSDAGIIGGTDGPTAILTATSLSHNLYWLTIVFSLVMTVITVACIILAFKVRRLDQNLK